MNEGSASSSFSSFQYDWNYDILLSFNRGDRCSNFASNLCFALWKRRIGTVLTPYASQAIRQCRIAIVVFSENYACSSICLNQLVQILDCFRGNGGFVCPVFYHADPSVVRRQTGSYNVAFDYHEKFFDDKVVKSWRSALTHASALFGRHVVPSKESCEHEVMKEIIRQISKVVNLFPLHVAEFPVGIESRVKDVWSLLNEQPHSDGATMGTDGIEASKFRWIGDPFNLMKFPRLGQVSLVDFSFDNIRSTSLSFQYGILRYLNLEGCGFLAEVPDFSGALNLEEVSVEHCKNLMKIHNTSGCHANLRALRARGCTNLISFLEDGINFPSLEILDLTGCSNFQKFPEILGEMENIKILALSGTAIETLPESIENLTGLECLYLYNCQKLCQIPVDSICRLTKLVRLEAGYCGIFNWFKDHEVQGTVNLAFRNISRLHLNENNISDQLLAVILKWFPRLKVLELRGNDITVLPACIEEYQSLKRLYLDGCKQLQEIRGIPQNIEVLSAVNCTSLTHVSVSSLLSQTLQVPGNRKFILPGGRVPDWIRCFNSGSSVSLRVRNKFPEFAICVVFDVKGRGSTRFEFGIRVLINGTHNFVVKTDVLDIESGHVYLFDGQRQEFDLNRELPGNKFNDVRISCSAHHKNGSSDAYSYVKYIGVYVYNFGGCADDIQFESPRRTLEDMICHEDCNFSVYSDSSREDRLYYKDFQATEAPENSCNGEMGSKRRGSRWHIWLCVIVSSAVLYRSVLHLLWLIHQSLGRFLSFVGYMEAGAMKP